MSAGKSMPLPICSDATAGRCVRRGARAGALATAVWERTAPAHKKKIDKNLANGMRRSNLARTRAMGDESGRKKEGETCAMQENSLLMKIQPVQNLQKILGFQ